MSEQAKDERELTLTLDKPKALLLIACAQLGVGTLMLRLTPSPGLLAATAEQLPVAMARLADAMEVHGPGAWDQINDALIAGLFFSFPEVNVERTDVKDLPT